MQRIQAIVSELKAHAPFTLFGAATGVLAMLLFTKASPEVNHRLFQIFHPGHVVLSAIVTASLFRLHEKKRGFLIVLVVGYLGSIGVATLSDSILPFFGESILGVALPSHAQLHEHGDERAGQTDPAHDDETHAEGLAEAEPEGPHATTGRPHIYLGFIEDWYLVNPAAILGVLIAWFLPRTRFPHAGHVLISTWASSFHMLMNTHRELTPTMFVGIFLILFIAVWLPCCVSDIIVPLLFVRSESLCACHHHHHHHAREEGPA
jgi:hypothetical protein